MATAHELTTALVEDVRTWVRSHEDDIVGLLQRLVQTPSETHPPGGDEGPVQRAIEAEMRDLRLDPDVFEPWDVEGATEHEGWWPGLEYHDRPNVVGTYRGPDASAGSLILNGHCDVVSAGDHGEWTTPPYEGALRDGAVYGRGAVDMKGGLAAMLMALRCLLDTGHPPAGTVILESVVNEELGGYNGTLSCCLRGYEADAAIVTEPTGFQIAVATKGGQVYRALVPGRPAHSCWWWKGVSALDLAIQFKAALAAWEDERAAETRSNPYYSDPSIHPKAAYADNIWSFHAGDPELMAHPGEAALYFWIEHLPGEDREALLARFEQFVRDFSAAHPFLREHPIRIERGAMRTFTGIGIDPEHAAVHALRDVHREVFGREAVVTGLPAATDSMIFNLYSNTPALNFGGGEAVEGRAHAVDEHLAVADLLDTTVALALTIARFCGSTES